ncbi:MAG: hypothetical protein LIO85_07700 [Rikenellaceae bacterium]|nr:hypothetical protein [Rikenellaceae bacterium]
MPAKTICLIVLALLPALRAGAQSGGEAQEPGREGFRGPVSGCIELSANLVFEEGNYKMQSPFYYTVTLMDEDGRVASRRWFNVETVGSRIDTISPHLFPERELMLPARADPLPLKPSLIGGIHSGAVGTSELLAAVYGGDCEIQYFYFSSVDNKPLAVIIADSAGAPMALVGFYPGDEPVEAIYHYRLISHGLFTDTYSYGENTILYERRNEDAPVIGIEYRYDGSELREVRMYDPQGRAAEIHTYSSGMRPRRREVLPSERHPHGYRYKYRYKGTDRNYTRTTVMGPGRHPWYCFTVDSISDGRIISTVTETAMPLPGRKRVSRRRGYGQITRLSLSYRYDYRGNIAEMTDLESGVTSCSVYRYDGRGNWYVKYMYTGLDPFPHTITCRSIRYRE